VRIQGFVPIWMCATEILKGLGYFVCLWRCLSDFLKMEQIAICRSLKIFEGFQGC